MSIPRRKNLGIILSIAFALLAILIYLVNSDSDSGFSSDATETVKADNNTVDENDPQSDDISSLTMNSHIAHIDNRMDSHINNHYVGSSTCRSCHEDQFVMWQGSHHDESMQIATPDTVKGNFNNTTYKSENFQGTFTQSEGRFFVETLTNNTTINSTFTDNTVTDNTSTSNNVTKKYSIEYTFGTEPLQQYLVKFPDGKLQALPIAWDTINNQWFDLQEGQGVQVDEWIHWTKGGLNWNSMCADCHSTNLDKNFDPETGHYETTWSEIDVSCESCHGPGKQHVELFQNNTLSENIENLFIDMQTGTPPKVLVDKCARCHSRRQALTKTFRHDSNNFLDHYRPEVLSEGLYHPDGQILDEVFVYGSFIQSKMYHANVSCIQCHEPHSASLKIEGNALCGQCHNPAQYDSPNHHHHSNTVSSSKVSANTINTNAGEHATGTQCVDCHMPGKIYMGNDFRRDHSFRVPRPDLSMVSNSPNACNQCHTDQNAEWAAKQIEAWFGPTRPAHFSETLIQARSNTAASLQTLINLLQDEAQPAITRATAAQVLTSEMQNPQIQSLMQAALLSDQALIRTAAAQTYYDLPAANKLSLLQPLLNDPVRSVRIATYRSLIDVPKRQISTNYRNAFNKAEKEYDEFLRANMEFPGTQLEIAINAQKTGRLRDSEQAYIKALTIDGRFNAARFNLANLHYQTGKLEQAEAVFRTILEQEPNAPLVHFSLGLLLAEVGNYESAKVSLSKAGELGNSRAWYNLAVIHHQQGEIKEAEKAYFSALQLDSLNPEFYNGIIALYLQQKRLADAKQLISNAIQQHPDISFLKELEWSLNNMQ